MKTLSDWWLSYARGQASPMRWLSGPLSAAAVLFRAAMACRTKAYTDGWVPSVRLPVPTISIGNLTLGGTGKTTLACWLARQLAALGRRPGIVLRGYGMRVTRPRVVAPGEIGTEEAILLVSSAEGAIVIEAADRWLGARMAIAQEGCDTIILDDGFQHHAIYRDLDIVLVDTLCPWGNALLIPAGILREPRRSLDRADIVILSRADLVGSVVRAKLADECRRLASRALIAAAAHRPAGLRCLSSDRVIRPEELAGREVALCSAIGNPTAFEHTVCNLGARIMGHLAFRDHHAFTERDFDKLLCRFRHVPMILCTSKDAVRLSRLAGSVPVPKLWALEVEWEFLSGEQEFRDRLANVLHQGTGCRPAG